MRHEAWSDFIARCARILNGLEGAQPPTVEELCQAIARQRGRSLTLSPLPRHAGDSAGVCGLWVGLRDSDHIFYEASTSGLHQRHIILHELAHLLLDHGTAGAGGSRAGVECLFPGLDPGMVRRLLARGRTDYSEAQEQEAEVMATLIHSRISTGVTGTSRTSGDTAHVLSRLERVLGPKARA
ncbi:ImmA/IrrE family metallo-endopeptidase [Streptomyces sp. NBC_01481]|uniref:ImmA/IrrE family metallo-endopeptidase n=1 Tax=Streptomyces sp. NBC_01481 TaxID=2975869 RepID=UPI00224CDF82|nr:hypothetical protein [Streptomyces sp. NBC_01481]MCX4586282.1 hypothetical protein [Streptomyces sp. NBC_01481]